ncbi:hypothetical protein DVH26_19580 [Paenibacillus sp. H1-7]|nr:hypothetical protein DVH26_19580 [Paenibacillus sp. H1-7]
MKAAMAMVEVMIEMKGGEHNHFEDKIAIYELIVSHPPSSIWIMTASRMSRKIMACQWDTGAWHHSELLET